MTRDEAPLAGFTVAVTAERRADDFGAALRRKGAEVRHAPTIRILPVTDDDQLRAATDAVVAAPVDIAVVMTGQGFRGWLSAAQHWQAEPALLETFARARVFVRGPKAAGAVRGAGLTEEWSAPTERNAELLDHLLAGDLDGRRIAVQVHGRPEPEFVGALEAAGASVVVAQPYRWLRPVDTAAVRRLVDDTVAGEIDAVAFTSAPAAATLLAMAEEFGRRQQLVDALSGAVLCACVGPVTAAPLVDAGVPVVQPSRQRLGALVTLLADTLPQSSTR